MTRYEINENIKKAISKFAEAYGIDDLRGHEQQFIDWYGWQDWMEDYTDAPEDEECSEAELDQINGIILGTWKECIQ